jgi:hypothetical protein
MKIIDATTLSGFAHKTLESISDFAGVVHNLIKDVRDSYRPELHYMRGPGPKWRAKHRPWSRFDSEAAQRPATFLNELPFRLTFRTIEREPGYEFLLAQARQVRPPCDQPG